MPRQAETTSERKNRLYRAEVAREMELRRISRKRVEALWGVCEKTAREKMRDPEKQTVREMRLLCELLHIPEEIKAEFI